MEKTKDKPEVIVLETSVIKLLTIQELKEMISKGRRVCSPKFCKTEIEKLALYISSLKANLEICKENIEFIDLEHQDQEHLKNKPRIHVKPRYIGVVALCCYLCEEGYKVILYTSSENIRKLAEMQRMEIEVRKVRE